MAATERRRVWPGRVSAVLAWLFAVRLLLDGATGPGLVLWPVAGVLVWLAIGVWKGRRRRAVALVVIGALGAVWLSYWTFRSAVFSEDLSFGPGQTVEVQRPLAWTVIGAVQAALAILMTLGALRTARATIDSGAFGAGAPAEAVDA